MATTAQSVSDICVSAKRAAHELATTDTSVRNNALNAIADALEANVDRILEANELDIKAGQEAGLDAALIDRLLLTQERVTGIAADVRKVVELEDPVGRIIEDFKLPNGLEVRKIAVPLGVVAVVYEARPNVTIDAAVLCLKSGNAIVLRGSSTAAHSNAVLAGIASEAVVSAGLPAAAVSLVAGGGREELRELATQEGLVDLIVPRGGEGLKKTLMEYATIPVLFAAGGNCHVYVDETADVGMAVEIVLNAKVQRPGVCNAAETLLVHAGTSADFLPRVTERLREAGVELHMDGRAMTAAGPEAATGAIEATEDDWATEYLAPVLAVRVVDSVDEAVEHINRYGTGHSEAIVTDSTSAAHRFTSAVDAACVYVNASTRFTDGGEFGMGAEIGNSTQKLHARGPVGLHELCSYKYIVEGTGQIRG